jgi:hypothetical protein
LTLFILFGCSFPLKGQILNIIVNNFAKLSPSSSSSWAELALISEFPTAGHPATRPPARQNIKTALIGSDLVF